MIRKYMITKIRTNGKTLMKMSGVRPRRLGIGRRHEHQETPECMKKGRKRPRKVARNIVIEAVQCNCANRLSGVLFDCSISAC